jgi:hypothetical protein
MFRVKAQCARKKLAVAKLFNSVATSVIQSINKDQVNILKFLKWMFTNHYAGSSIEQARQVTGERPSLSRCARRLVIIQASLSHIDARLDP